VVVTQRRLDEALSHQSELKDKYSTEEQLQDGLIQGAVSAELVAKSELAVMDGMLAKFKESSEATMATARIRLDASKAEMTRTRAAAEEAAKQLSITQRDRKAAISRKAALEEQKQQLVKRVEELLTLVEKLSREYKSEHRRLVLRERNLDEFQREQMWHEIRKRKKEASRRIEEAKQEAIAAAKAHLLAERAAVEQKQNALDRKRTMHDKLEADATLLKSRSDEAIAAAKASIEQAESESKLVVMHSTKDLEQALTDARASRERSQIQTAAADAKVEKAQSRALAEEDKANKLKSVASAMQLHAAETAKGAAELRQQQQQSESDMRAAEQNHFEYKKEAIQIEKSWRDRLRKAKQDEQDAHLALKEHTRQVKELRVSLPPIESELEDSHKRLRSTEVKMAEQQAIAQDGIKQAQAEAIAEQRKAKKGADEVKMTQDEMVVKVQDEMNHKIKMVKMASDTKQYIASNNAKIQIVDGEREAGLRIIDHNSTFNEANLRHNTLKSQTEHHVRTKQEAVTDLKSFKASQAQTTKLSAELKDLYSSPDPSNSNATTLDSAVVVRLT